MQTRLTLKEPVSLEDKYSHPWELIKLLRDYVGNDRIEAMLQADNQTPPTVVQVNTLKTSADALLERLRGEHVQARPHGWMPDCLVLSGTGDLERLPSFRDGLFYVQDAAARLSVLCAQLPRADIRLLDCCAAPGGKSFAAAIAMGGRGEILSCDIHEHKTKLISGGAARLGLGNITARQQDAAENVVVIDSVSKRFSACVERRDGRGDCGRALLRLWNHPEKTGYSVQKPGGYGGTSKNPA